jgi:hypothetical protein
MLESRHSSEQCVVLQSSIGFPQLSQVSGIASTVNVMIKGLGFDYEPMVDRENK